MPALRRAGMLVALTAVMAPLGAIAATGVSKARSKFAVGSSSVRTAQQIARAYWGTDPCSGVVTIRWSRMGDPSINALSSWLSYGPAYANPAANEDCRVDFNSSAEFDWPKFCTVLVHEYGHLAGRPHDDRAGHLMSPVYSAPLPECEEGVATARSGASRVTARRGHGSRRSASGRRGG